MGEREKLKRQLGGVAKTALELWEADSRNTASGETRLRNEAVGDAILAALEAAGVRLVPVEATTEMQNAAAPLLAEVNSIIAMHAVRTGSEGLKQPVTLAQIYAAMLAASPFSPPAKDAP